MSSKPSGAASITISKRTLAIVVASVGILIAGLVVWSLTRSSDDSIAAGTDSEVSNPGSADQIFTDLGTYICGSEIPIQEDSQLFRGAARQAACLDGVQGGWFGVYSSTTALDTMLNSLSCMDDASYVRGDQWIAMTYDNGVATSLQDDGGGTLLSCS